MAKLSYLKKMIDAYLEMKGDKELLSVGTCNGGEDEFTLHLADIWDGPIGSNPFSGRDTLHLKRRSEDVPEDAPAEVLPKSAALPTECKKAYFELEEQLRKDKEKPVNLRLTVAWGALTALHAVGGIDKQTMNAIWMSLALEFMGLS